MDPDVPLLIPDVNPDHTGLIPVQRAQHGTAGLHRRPTPTARPRTSSAPSSRCRMPSGWPAVNVVSMQAISGAGYPGVSALDILDNVVPLHRRRRREGRDGTAQAVGEPARRGTCAWPISRSARSATGWPCATGISRRFRSSWHVRRRWRKLPRLSPATRLEPQRLGLPSAPDPAIILHSRRRPPAAAARPAGRQGHGDPGRPPAAGPLV